MDGRASVLQRSRQELSDKPVTGGNGSQLKNLDKNIKSQDYHGAQFLSNPGQRRIIRKLWSSWVWENNSEGDRDNNHLLTPRTTFTFVPSYLSPPILNGSTRGHLRWALLIIAYFMGTSDRIHSHSIHSSRNSRVFLFIISYTIITHPYRPHGPPPFYYYINCTYLAFCLIEIHPLSFWKVQVREFRSSLVILAKRTSATGTTDEHDQED